jgi:hypothetical protein
MERRKKRNTLETLPNENQGGQKEFNKRRKNKPKQRQKE